MSLLVYDLAVLDGEVEVGQRRNPLQRRAKVVEQEGEHAQQDQCERYRNGPNQVRSAGELVGH